MLGLGSLLDTTGLDDGLIKTIIGLIWMLIPLFAIYLSFKCNEGFDILGFLGAIIFQPIYIIYKLATGCDPF